MNSIQAVLTLNNYIPTYIHIEKPEPIKSISILFISLLGRTSMSISIYLGGCYNNLENIRFAQKILLEIPEVSISYDWTVRAMDRHPRTPDNLAIDAELDIQGVLKANWTVLLMTDKDYIYRGTFTELGASIARDILRNQSRTIIVGSAENYAGDCCFWHHPNVIHLETMEQVKEYIMELWQV